MSNHIVIGLGGTGGRIIRELRKQVYQNLQTDDPAWVNLRYLYLDTEDELLKPGAEATWRVLGHRSTLDEQSKMLLKGIDLRRVIEQPSAYPGVGPWIGEKKNYDNLVKAAEGARKGAGQRRRLGRFLFATNASAFNERLKALVNSMHTLGSAEAERKAGVTFHVCAGLAGGTGSGSLVDALAQIRRQYPQDEQGNYTIIVYAVLPARHPDHPVDSDGYYAANGYAALRELNAAVLGRWRPHDVSGTVVGRLNLQNIFDSCYLFGDESTESVCVDLTKEAPAIIASYLYQRAVEEQRLAFEGKDVDAIEKFENPSVKGLAEQDEVQRDVRTTRFLSFGIRQVVYPEIEIREYLTYSFALEAARQMLFNHWVEGVGFEEKEANLPLREWVNSPERLERWSLTAERLMLSQGILKKEKENAVWKAIPDFWRTTIARLSEEIRNGSSDKKLMLFELTRRCDEVFSTGYRSHGVAKFYELKRGGDLRDQVRELRAAIEKDLFGEWRDGEKSLTDIRRTVEELVAMLNARVADFDRLIAANGPLSERVRDLDRRIKETFDAAARTGPLSSLIGKRNQLFDTQAQNYVSLYTIRTEVEGYRYGRELAVALRQELESLTGAVRVSAQIVSEAAKQLSLEKNARCLDIKGNIFQQAIIQCYEPDKVRDYTRSLTTDRKLQTTQASTVRAAIAAKLGAEQSLLALSNKLDAGLLFDVMDEKCQLSAQSADDERQDNGRVLKVQLIEKLRQQFSGNEESLKDYWTRVMQLAGQNLAINNDEVQMKPCGNTNHMRTAVYCVLPEAPEAKDFRDKLAAVIRGTTYGSVAMATNTKRSQEITVLSVSSMFPARFAKVLRHLRDEYTARLSGDAGATNFIALHLEGTRDSFAAGQSMPDLMAERYTSEDMMPYALLGKEMGLLTSSEDVSTGATRLYLMLPRENGRVRAEDAAPTLESFIADADARWFLSLRPEVERLLGSQYLHRSERQKLLEKLKDERAEDLRRSPTHPLYQKASEELQAVEKLLGNKEQYAN